MKPFGRSRSEKVTTVYGPRQGDWQIEELQLLQDCGWTVFYQSTMLPDKESGRTMSPDEECGRNMSPDEQSGSTMLRAEPIYINGALLRKDTKTTMDLADEEESSKTVIESYLQGATVTISDNGISIALRRVSVLPGQ